MPIMVLLALAILLVVLLGPQWWVRHVLDRHGVERIEPMLALADEEQRPADETFGRRRWDGVGTRGAGGTCCWSRRFVVDEEQIHGEYLTG